MEGDLRLLIHVAQKERWDVAVENGLNFLRSSMPGEDLRVRIVANGDSVARCIKCDRPLFDRLKQLVLDGGHIYLCENSLAAFDIPVSRLPDLFETVPAAIRFLADSQREGWIYVRP